MDDIGTDILHTYIITNYGPWRAKSVSVDIQWPYEVVTNRYSKESGRGLLYPLLANVTSGHCTFPDHFPPNYLNLKEVNSFVRAGHSRSKREAIVASKEIMEDGKTLNVVQMVCTGGNVLITT